MSDLHSFEANIASLSRLLREIKETLYDAGYDYEAQEIRDASARLYRMKQEHDAAVQKLQSSNTSLRNDLAAEKESLRQALQQVQVQKGNVDSAKDIIREAREVVRKRDAEIKRLQDSLAESKAREQKSAAALREEEERVERRDQTIKSHERRIAELEGAFRTGFHQHAAHPAGPSPHIDTTTRERWLHKLDLSSSYALPSPIKRALILGNADLLRNLLDTNGIGAAPVPALHIACLLGDTEVAKVLLRRGAGVNDTITIQSANGKSHNYGVTPMHLAVGARHEDMITLLRRCGGRLGFDEERMRDEGGKWMCAAPVCWMLSERLLELSDARDVEGVLRVLRLLKGLGWDEGAVVNAEGEGLREWVREKMVGNRWKHVRRGVLEWLSGERF